PRDRTWRALEDKRLAWAAQLRVLHLASDRALSRVDPYGVLQPGRNAEVAFVEVRQAQGRFAAALESERQRHSQPDFHLAAGRHGKELHQDAVGTGRGHEHRIAVLPHDPLVGLAHAGAARERGFALLAVDPKRYARHDRAR